jgi:hypothetical protein
MRLSDSVVGHPLPRTLRMLHFGRGYEGRVYPRRRRRRRLYSLPWPQSRMQEWQHHDRIEQHEQHRA